MKIKVDEPSIPKDIQQKIRNLQVLLEQADSLRDEILTWYVKLCSSFIRRSVLKIRLTDKERADPLIKGSALFRSPRGYAGKNKISRNLKSS